jgi:hypothetical protein
MFRSKKKSTVFSIKEGRMVRARNQLHIKVATKTYETDYEMPCTAESRKSKTLGGVFVSVCLMSLAALRVRFPVCLGGMVVCLIHMKHTSWDAADTFS